MSDLLIPFDDIAGGRTKPGTPSPYRTMTWRQLLDADYWHMQEGVVIAREKDRRIKSGCYDPEPLRLVKDEQA